MNITEREHTILSGPLSRTTSFRIAIRGRMCKADVDRLIEKITAERDNLASADDSEATPRQEQTSLPSAVSNADMSPKAVGMEREFKRMLEAGGDVVVVDTAQPDGASGWIGGPEGDFRALPDRTPAAATIASNADNWIKWEADVKTGIAACKTNGELLDYEQAIKPALVTAPAVIADGVKAAFARRKV